MQRKYDSTVARMAGNIIGGDVYDPAFEDKHVERVVRIARKIIAEVKRTEPKEINE